MKLDDSQSSAYPESQVGPSHKPFAHYSTHSNFTASSFGSHGSLLVAPYLKSYRHVLNSTRRRLFSSIELVNFLSAPDCAVGPEMTGK